MCVCLHVKCSPNYNPSILGKNQKIANPPTITPANISWCIATCTVHLHDFKKSLRLLIITNFFVYALQCSMYCIHMYTTSGEATKACVAHLIVTHFMFIGSCLFLPHFILYTIWYVHVHMIAHVHILHVHVHVIAHVYYMYTCTSGEATKACVAGLASLRPVKFRL